MRMTVGIWILGLILGANASAVSAYKLDVAASNFKWTGKKVSGEHFGKITFKSGSVSLDKGIPVGGEFVLDMTTIVDLDIESAEYRTKLETHLKSPDFFAVEKFPTATFTIGSAKPSATKGEFDIAGTLKIKDIAKPVKFVAKMSEDKDMAKATAKFEINRLDWDIRYNSGKFFDVQKLGDKLIYDQIGIELDLTAKAEPAPAKKS